MGTEKRKKLGKLRRSRKAEEATEGRIGGF